MIEQGNNSGIPDILIDIENDIPCDSSPNTLIDTFLNKNPEDKQVQDAFICCILYYMFMCICPFNMICGIYSYSFTLNNDAHKASNTIIQMMLIIGVIIMLVLLYIIVIKD